MIRSALTRAVLAFSIIGGASFVGACQSDTAGEQDPNVSGVLNLPLITMVGDTRYRLNGVLDVYGPTYVQLDTWNDPDGTVLTASLMTGDYTAYLFNWTLERENEAGEFVQVSASLVSPPYANFTIFNASTTTISFQFETDGSIVSVGNGNLRVTFGVTEVPPVCTVLGDDCPEGNWCAPAELTGAGYLACIPSGTVALGEPCTSPRECVANASCFDYGSGPVCGAVCLSEEFGAECGSGGTCAPVGTQFGACVPEGGTPPSSGSGGGGGEGGVGGAGGTAGKGGVGGRGGFGGSPMMPSGGVGEGGAF